MSTLTTSDAAVYAGVTTATVRRWLDRGILPGWKLPGSKHRRVHADDLVRFLEEYRMPVSDELRKLVCAC